jgi:hypothetical protein
MASLEEQLRDLLAAGATYLQPVYPGESEEARKAWSGDPAVARSGEPAAGTNAHGSPAGPRMAPDCVIWTNLDEIEAPPGVHGSWAAEVVREVPDWRRENVRIHPFAGGQRVDVPGGEIEDLADGGYVVEQTGIGTTLDGQPYRVHICHVMYVEDGRIVRNNQYWGGPDGDSVALMDRLLDTTRRAYAQRSASGQPDTGRL